MIMSEINLIVQSDGRLRPSLPADLDIIRKYKAGVTIKAKVTRRRNPDHHRKFFALLGVVVKHTDYEDVDEVLHILKLRLGHFDPIIDLDSGKTFLKPRSISFDNMDQNKFDDFYRRSVDVILQNFLHEWTTDTLGTALEEVRDFA